MIRPFLVYVEGWGEKVGNSLEHEEVTKWEDLIEKFMKKFVPPIKNDRRR